MEQWNHRQGTVTTVLVLILLIPLALFLGDGWSKNSGAWMSLLAMLTLCYVIAASHGNDRQNLLFANIALLIGLFLALVAGWRELAILVGIAVLPLAYASLALAICASIRSKKMLQSDRSSVELAAWAAIALTLGAGLFLV